MKKVIAVIPTHNRRIELERLLNQIECENKAKIDLQTIVVVAGSSDGTIELLKNHFPAVQVVEGNSNWWYTKCMNEGFKAAGPNNPDFILTLNDDVILNDDYFDKLGRIVEENDGITIVNSITLTATKPFRIINGGVKKYIRWRGKQVRYFKPFEKVNIEQLTGLYPNWIISGRGILIPYLVLKMLNFFDDKFPQYGSDDDFGLRAIKSGYKVYISRDMKIFQDTRLTSKGVAYNRDGLKEFIKSFFNKYSVNSLQKTIRYTIKHGYPILLPLNIVISILGTSYAYLIKYRNIKDTFDG